MRRRDCFAWLAFPAALARGAARTPVVVVGIDGLGGSAVREADSPVFARLRREGAWTLNARGVMPTVSSPNWASMIMGARPESHGVTSNDWQPDRYTIAPAAKGEGGFFPTIFGQLRARRSEARIAAVHDWEGFGRLVEPGAASVKERVKGSPAAARRFVEVLRRERPDFAFLHLDDVDHAGHEHGHGSAEHRASVLTASGMVGEVLASAGAGATVLVTADHGGVGKKHGGESMAELEIPWMLTGPGVRRGHELQIPVSTCDTAPTLARILGIPAHPAWTGRVVREAFR